MVESPHCSDEETDVHSFSTFIDKYFLCSYSLPSPILCTGNTGAKMELDSAVLEVIVYEEDRYCHSNMPFINTLISTMEGKRVDGEDI